MTVIKKNRLNFRLKEIIFFTSITSLNPISVYAQTIEQSERELKCLIPKIQKAKTESERMESALAFSNGFKKVLEKPESFNYSFDSLTNLSRAFSDDGKIKIYTFLVPLEGGDYRYFGFVQKLSDRKNGIQLIELIDQKDEIKNFSQAQTSNRKWHGAIYYRCITNTYKKNTYYTLLGWDGHTRLTNRKFIEPMLINDRGEIKFGKAMFTDEANKRSKRIIFEYAEQVSMSLKYYPESQEIIFDHLSPPEPQLTGQFQFYGPDFSYDSYKFEKGKWVLVKDVLPRNEKESERYRSKTKKIKDKILYKPK